MVVFYDDTAVLLLSFLVINKLIIKKGDMRSLLFLLRCPFCVPTFLRCIENIIVCTYGGSSVAPHFISKINTLILEMRARVTRCYPTIEAGCSQSFGGKRKALCCLTRSALFCSYEVKREHRCLYR